MGQHDEIKNRLSVEMARTPVNRQAVDAISGELERFSKQLAIYGAQSEIEAHRKSDINSELKDRFKIDLSPETHKALDAIRRGV